MPVFLWIHSAAVKKYSTQASSVEGKKGAQMLKMLKSSTNEYGKELGNEFPIWQLQQDKATLANNWNIVVQFQFLAIIQKSDNYERFEK